MTLHILLNGYILSYAKVHYDKINCHMKMNSIKHTHEENKQKHSHQETLDFLYQDRDDFFDHR